MSMPQDREAVAQEAQEMREAEQEMADRMDAKDNQEDAELRSTGDEVLPDDGSPEGRQNAMKRGQNVQLQGEEANQGYVEGTNPAMTSNETPARPNTVEGGQQRGEGVMSGTAGSAGQQPPPSPYLSGESRPTGQEQPEGYVEPASGDPAGAEPQAAGEPALADTTATGSTGSQDPEASQPDGETDPHGDAALNSGDAQSRDEETAGNPEFGPGSTS